MEIPPVENLLSVSDGMTKWQGWSRHTKRWSALPCSGNSLPRSLPQRGPLEAMFVLYIQPPGHSWLDLRGTPNQHLASSNLCLRKSELNPRTWSVYVLRAQEQAVRVGGICCHVDRRSKKVNLKRKENNRWKEPQVKGKVSWLHPSPWVQPLLRSSFNCACPRVTWDPVAF